MTSYDFDRKYSGKIVGIDEAGRGPLAGPVVAAAVSVDPDNLLDGVTDSKKLSVQKRELLYEKITELYKYSVGVVSAEEIDDINILQATIRACRLAEGGLIDRADTVLVDGNMKFSDPRFISVIKGDLHSYSIAAASIVAKVTRDRLMQELALKYPQYLWHKNAGYGTWEHIDAINTHGLTAEHRKSFKVRSS